MLTLPGLLLGASTFLGRIYPALIWVPQWWAWVLAITGGLFLASWSAWHEQFTVNRTLYGRPDVSLVSRYEGPETPGFTFKDFAGLRLLLKNTGTHTAVNVCALPIVVPIPEALRQEWERETQEIEKGSPATKDYKSPREWTTSFEVVARLGALNSDGEKALEYRISSSNPLHQCVSHVLEKLVDTKELRAKLELVVVFSNLGDPVRTWHAHYDLEYYLPDNLHGKKLVTKFVGYAECRKGKREECSRCQKHGQRR